MMNKIQTAQNFLVQTCQCVNQSWASKSGQGLRQQSWRKPAAVSTADLAEANKLFYEISLLDV